MVPLSLLLGSLAATRAGRTADHGISLDGARRCIALPEFVVGSLLIVVFFAWLDLLPPVALIPPGESPLSHPKALVLPVLTLLAATLACCTRMVRAGIVETLALGLRADGAAERPARAPRRLALRAAQRARADRSRSSRRPSSTCSAGSSSSSTSSPTPASGKELVDAVAIRDVREVQSIAILIAAFYIFVNIVADLARRPARAEAADPQCVSRLRFAAHRHRPRSARSCCVAIVLVIAIFGPFFAPHSLDRARSASPYERAERRGVGSAPTSSAATCSAACSGAGAACVAAGAAWRRCSPTSSAARDRPRRRVHALARSTRC